MLISKFGVCYSTSYVRLNQLGWKAILNYTFPVFELCVYIILDQKSTFCNRGQLECYFIGKIKEERKKTFQKKNPVFPMVLTCSLLQNFSLVTIKKALPPALTYTPQSLPFCSGHNQNHSHFSHLSPLLCGHHWQATSATDVVWTWGLGASGGKRGKGRRKESVGGKMKEAQTWHQQLRCSMGRFEESNSACISKQNDKAGP